MRGNPGRVSLRAVSRLYFPPDRLPHQAPGAGAGSRLCCPGDQGWSPAVQPQRCLHQEGADRERTQGLREGEWPRGSRGGYQEGRKDVRTTLD